MANELFGFDPSSGLHYFVLFNAARQVANVLPPPAFEDWNDAHYVTYAQPATEMGSSGWYKADIPASLLADTTSFAMYRSLMSSPMLGDPMVWQENMATSTGGPATIIDEDNDVTLQATTSTSTPARKPFRTIMRVKPRT
jgi:hypothetical protein